MFFRNLPVGLQQEANAYAERKRTADAATQFAHADFNRWAEDFFTLKNERVMVRPLANVLGYLQADDDIDIMSFAPIPHDLRSAAVEGQDSFEILHAAAGMSGITKYAAMFGRDAPHR